MSSSLRGKRALLAIPIVIIAGLLVWFVSKGKEPPAKKVVATEQPEASGSAPSTVPSLGGGPGLNAENVDEPPPSGNLREVATQKAIETRAEYLEFAKYPPNSRPADGSQEHLIVWNREIVDEQAMTYDDRKRRISVTAKLDRYFAEKGQSLTVTVQVWHGEKDDPQTMIPFELIGHIEVYDGDTGTNPLTRSGAGPGYKVVDSFEFKRGKDINERVASFIPSQMKELTEGPVEARATVWVQLGEDRKPYSMTFSYVTDPPLEVLGKADESSASGSLDIDLNVDIKVKGPVLVQATLFDGTGTIPIAVYDDYYRPEKLGKQTIPLHFFGKIISEKGLNGPYLVKSVHGHIKQLDKVPEELWWEYHTPIKTREYRASDFSGSDWQSPEKDAKIKQYDEYVEDLGSGRL